MSEFIEEIAKVDQADWDRIAAFSKKLQAGSRLWEGPATPMFGELALGASRRVGIRSAAKNGTALHRDYYGGQDFARRVYEAQLDHTARLVANLNVMARMPAKARMH